MKLATQAKRLGLDVEIELDHEFVRSDNGVRVTYNKVWIFDAEDDSEPLGYFMTNGACWQWRRVWAGETGCAFASEKDAGAYLKTLMPTVHANR